MPIINCPSNADQAFALMSRQSFSRRLWDKDPSLWNQDPDGTKVIQNRLGWLNIIETMIQHTDEISQFADEIRADGFNHAVLMGMGGSSLNTELSRLTFGVKPGYPDLIILDSTVPASVLEVERRIDLSKTLFIVATKSGTTVETLSEYQYFYHKAQSACGDSAGNNFIAITDPETPLTQEARDKNFRRVFLNPADIGGRYSALSYFGLVPASIIGVDIARLLDSAAEMAEKCEPAVDPQNNPGLILGAVMAECAKQGKDKLTLILTPEISSLGYWIEQLVAESTGKNGTGILPVEGEPLASPDNYSDDRLFVYLRLDNADNAKLDTQVQALENSGHPVVYISLNDLYDLGHEYFRWEFAIATTGALLGINPFDEPNVKESKDNTDRLLAEFLKNGRFPTEQPALVEDEIQLYCDERTKASLKQSDCTLASYLRAYLNLIRPSDYVALMAFLNSSRSVDGLLQNMRVLIRDAYHSATTVGYGPRFLHSTGQLHKGGPNTGVFLQFTADDPEDVPIPGQPYSLRILKQAQAMGDEIALREKGRRVIRLHLGSDVSGNLKKVLDCIKYATDCI